MSEEMGKLWHEVLKKTGETTADDYDAALARIFNEPPDPRLLALAGKAIEAMKRDKAYLDSLSPEERERVEAERLEKLVQSFVETPFYEAELLGICKAEDVK